MRSKRGSSTQTMCYVVAYDIPDGNHGLSSRNVLIELAPIINQENFSVFTQTSRKRQYELRFINRVSDD